jgi:hypothetical protein
MQNSVWGVRAIELILYGLQECKEDGWEEVGDDESVGLVAGFNTPTTHGRFMGSNTLTPGRQFSAD